MIDPSVRVVLLAHSMGGIVAADTLLSILDDEPIPHPSRSADDDPKRSGSLDPRKNENDEELDIPDDTIIFPAIVGICAFDTPYLVRQARLKPRPL